MSCLDLTATLYSQPVTYWSGDYLTAAEGNPLVKAFMFVHPMLMVFGWLTSFYFICWAILRLRIDWACDIALFFIFGQAYCASAWLWAQNWGVYAVVFICLVAFTFSYYVLMARSKLRLS